jgi:hypothetical protein
VAKHPSERTAKARSLSDSATWGEYTPLDVENDESRACRQLDETLTGVGVETSSVNEDDDRPGSFGRGVHADCLTGNLPPPKASLIHRRT